MSRLTLAAAVAASLLLTLSIPAYSAHASASDSPTVANGDMVIAKGWTDVSALERVPTNTEAEKTRTGAVPPVRGTAFDARPMVNQVDCNGRIDFYRVINSHTGQTWCFSWAGQAYWEWGGGFQADTLCPGNNTGEVLWSESYKVGTAYWSITRDGHQNFNRCWSFDHLVWIKGIRIH